MTDVFNDGDIVDMSSDVHEYSSFVNLRSLERKVTGILLGPEIKLIPVCALEAVL